MAVPVLYGDDQLALVGFRARQNVNGRPVAVSQSLVSAPRSLRLRVNGGFVQIATRSTTRPIPSQVQRQIQSEHIRNATTDVLR